MEREWIVICRLGDNPSGLKDITYADFIEIHVSQVWGVGGRC